VNTSRSRMKDNWKYSYKQKTLSILDRVPYILTRE
jgi:hypothetical protein